MDYLQGRPLYTLAEVRSQVGDIFSTCNTAARPDGQR